VSEEGLVEEPDVHQVLLGPQLRFRSTP